MKRKQRLRSSQKYVVSCNRVTVRKLAKVIDNLVANYPAVNISDEGKTEIQWSIYKINNTCHHIFNSNPDIGIYTDASLTGWGITETIHFSRACFINQK